MWITAKNFLSFFERSDHCLSHPLWSLQNFLLRWHILISRLFWTAMSIWLIGLNFKGRKISLKYLLSLERSRFFLFTLLFGLSFCRICVTIRDKLVTRACGRLVFRCRSKAAVGSRLYSELTEDPLLAGQRRPEIGRRLSLSNLCLFCHFQRIIYLYS